MTPARRSRTVRGRTISWREVGTGPDVVVLLHAVGLSSGWWESHLEVLPSALLDRTRVLAFDLPGHGASDALDPVASPVMLEALAAELAPVIIEAAQQTSTPGRVDIVGVSMGGMIAQHLAAHIDIVTGLVLVATAATFPDAARAAIRERAATVRAEGAAALAPRTIERWFAPALVATRAEVVMRAFGDLSGLDAETHARCWEAIAALDTTVLLADLRCSTVVLAGEADVSVPIGRAHELVAALRSAHLEIVEDGSHMFAFERTDWLHPALTALVAIPAPKDPVVESPGTNDEVAR